MKAIILFLSFMSLNFLSLSAKAEGHIFSKEQRVVKTEFPCLWSTRSCDTEQMAADLIEKCTNRGYDDCHVIRSNVKTVRFNANGICGATRTSICQVQVKGQR